MPGHEIVGSVTEAGARVTRHEIGDMVVGGCTIESCRTYGGPGVPANAAPNSGNHYGHDKTCVGYSDVIVVNEGFASHIPPALTPEVVVPIPCAGVTTYAPMKCRGA